MAGLEGRKVCANQPWPFLLVAQGVIVCRKVGRHLFPDPSLPGVLVSSLQAFLFEGNMVLSSLSGARALVAVAVTIQQHRICVVINLLMGTSILRRLLPGSYS